MSRKLMLMVLAVGLAGSTLACGVVNNLVDRAVEEAEEAVIEQVEEQTGEDLPDMESLQATADAAMESLDDVEGLEDLEDAIPDEFGATGESGFPMMDGAEVLLEQADNLQYTVEGVVIADALTFYRETFTSQGLTERDVTSVIQDAYASMVFDGDPSGKAIILQVVDLGNGTITVSLTRGDA